MKEFDPSLYAPSIVVSMQSDISVTGFENGDAVPVDQIYDRAVNDIDDDEAAVGRPVSILAFLTIAERKIDWLFLIGTTG